MWAVEDGVMKDVAFYPIDLAQKGTHFQRGTPKSSGSTSTLEHIKRLSEPYGTIIEIRDGVGYVKMH